MRENLGLGRQHFWRVKSIRCREIVPRSKSSPHTDSFVVDEFGSMCWCNNIDEAQTLILSRLLITNVPKLTVSDQDAIKMMTKLNSIFLLLVATATFGSSLETAPKPKRVREDVSIDKTAIISRASKLDISPTDSHKNALTIFVAFRCRN
jgi:hypothetical protein